MKYQFICDHRHRFEVRVMARVLGVTASAYRAWKSRGSSARKREDAVLREDIKTIHENSKRTYGSPRIKASLLKQGKRVSRARTNRLMREAGCQTKYRRKFVVTTKTKHSNSVVENRLNREFRVVS